jgi:hypothetical protein
MSKSILDGVTMHLGIIEYTLFSLDIVSGSIEASYPFVSSHILSSPV